MHEYTLARSTKHCRLSNRQLKPGERYYSVVVSEAGETLRYDVSESMWEGPPENAVGWWKNEMPPPAPKKRRPTPNKELVEKLAELCDDPSQAILAHLLALLLLRRRVLRCEDEGEVGQPGSHHEWNEKSLHAVERSSETPGPLCIVHPPTQRQFFIPQIDMTDSDCDRFDDQLQALLFVETSDDSSESEGLEEVGGNPSQDGASDVLGEPNNLDATGH